MRTAITFAVFCCIISCRTTREASQYPFLRKGCDIDSVRKYSEIYFNQAAKKLREPEGIYKTVVYEADSLIIVEQSPVDPYARAGGHTFKILKRTCTVIDVKSYQ
jgi:hypothetical protein